MTNDAMAHLIIKIDYSGLVLVKARNKEKVFFLSEI